MPTGKTKKLSSSDISQIALFAAVMAVCSWIAVPASVPFTMQTFGVFLAVGVLGGRRGTLAVLIYLLIGMAGAPVFSGFSGGIGALFGSTGGYIIGFLFSALAMWALEHALGEKRWVLLVSMLVGLLVCYAFGSVWFRHIFMSKNGDVGLWTVLLWCVIPYIIPDAIKLFLAFCLCGRLKRLCRLK